MTSARLSRLEAAFAPSPPWWTCSPGPPGVARRVTCRARKTGGREKIPGTSLALRVDSLRAAQKTFGGNCGGHEDFMGDPAVSAVSSQIPLAEGNALMADR
jgi:hypothetical protein